MFSSKCISKPSAIVRLEDGLEYLQNPPPLKSLSMKVLVQLFTCLQDVPNETDVTNLRLYIHQLPCVLQQQIHQSVQSHYSRATHFVKHEQDLLFILWKLFFSDRDKKLVLEEFLGNHWSSEVFKFLIESDADFQAITCLDIGSQQIDKKRLSYLFEITESTWKPEFRTLLSKLPNLVDLTLNEFCDDDTISLVGKHCKKMKNLVVIIKPESFQEQQLTDDGFLDLIDSQEKYPSLARIDLSSCYTSAVTAKAIINLEKIKTLVSLHVRSSHLHWLHLYHKLLRQTLRPNTSLTVLNVELSLYPEEIAAFFDGENSVIKILPLVFPQVGEFNLFHWAESAGVTEHAEGGRTCPELETLGFKTKVLSVDHCKKLELLPRIFPNIQKLELRDLKIHQDALTVPFGQLKVVHLIKDLLPISFQVVADIMKNSLKLTEIKVVASKIIDATDEGFVETFNQNPHLKRLEEFSITVTSGESCQLTILLVHFLLLNCSNLRRVEKLVTWNISKEDVDRDILRETGFAVVMAKRKHWSLPWKGEDGTVHYEGSLTF